MLQAYVLVLSALEFPVDSSQLEPKEWLSLVLAVGQELHVVGQGCTTVLFAKRLSDAFLPSPLHSLP